jgi:L-lactate dehydrogenase (cytochrome)
MRRNHASGARSGLIGKAFLCGLGAGGEAGVTKAIELIRRELSLTMALTGALDASRVSPDILWRG